MRTADRIAIADSLRAHRRARSPIAGALLVALCAAVYLPGVFSIPPLDRDESRFAQASRQMLQSGDWIVPRFQDRTRLNKPPLTYWLQAGSARLLDDPAARHAQPSPEGPPAAPLDPADDPTGGIWRYRLPSVAAATLAVLLTWRLGARMFDARAALAGAALLAVCPIVVADAHQARADQILLATVVAAQGALWFVWRSRRSRRAPVAAPLAFWVALSLGVMTKGPVAPMIAALTALFLSVTTRHWRWLLRLRPLAGLAVVGAVAGAWLALVAGQVGWDHLAERLYRELVERQTSPMEGHRGPPGYHLALLVVLFWPGTLATAAGLVRAWRRGVRRGAPVSVDRPARAAGRDAERFCLAWILPAWLVFEAVGTKLPHYTMPLYPPLAMLSARALLSLRPGPATADGTRPRPIGLVAITAWAGVGLALLVGVPVALAFLDDAAGPLSALDLAAVFAARIAALGLLAAAVAWLLRSRPVAAQAAAVAGAAIWLAAIFGLTLPRHCGDAWVSNKVVNALRTIDPALDRPIAAVGYHEDSLVFLTGGRVRRIDHPARRDGEDDLDDFLDRHPRGLAVVPAGLAPDRHRVRAVASVTGWNYSRGQRVALDVVEAEP
jgi:4-amino-4-deoxy-L-arabinose transferase-like glycosyltransferase